MESLLNNDQSSVYIKENRIWLTEEQHLTDKLMDITWKEYLSQFIVHHIGVGNLS